jgi:hypothetical protein
MEENKKLIAAEIREIESRIELNKAHADLLRAQAEITRTNQKMGDQTGARSPSK